jgi:formate hydrogenlyase subunit 3/multisubunit Na+/H+ antiporter MnhD subunit
MDYLRRHHEDGAGRYYPNFLVFVAAMYGLVSTTDLLHGFLLFWQLMTLAGYALIRYERRKLEHVRAANKYLGMMQLACAAIVGGAGLLVRSGAPAPAGDWLAPYDVDALGHCLPEILRANSGGAALAFGLFLLGFGIKLGMWPFGQLWLPDAHPAAPSPVSALLSGVMIKTGVYGLMRCFLWLVPLPARADFPLAGWGAAMALLGTITLLTGTVQALKQDQSKRMLAFSSIGQGGYILLGLGVCLTLLASPDPALGALAAAGFYGALFHALNHGLFKSLLFLNAGAVLHVTDTQDLNQLGGLMRFMPVTALTCLVASLAIAGVPLLNGFASKWTIYGAAVLGGESARFLPVCALVAMLTSALTLALFLKFFGVTFLARASGHVAQRAARHGSLEVGWKMRVSQLALASVCGLIGLLPALAIALIHQALQASRQGLGIALAEAPPPALGRWAGLGGEAAVYVPLALLGVLAFLFLLARGVTRLALASRRSAAPWLCGYAREAEAHRYPARHFYAEIKSYFRWFGGAPPP